MDYFITAIGTDSGKTLISAILLEALQADYWKPVQAGFPKDTDQVRELVSNADSKFHNEQYILDTPASPHAAAKIDRLEIELNKFRKPQTDNQLIIEGAGGLMVPLNDSDLVIDIARKLQCKIILVSNHYLGSINHSLLSIDYLKKLNLPVEGIIFNGNEVTETERIISQHSPFPILGRIPRLHEVNKQTIKEQAERVREWL